MSKNINIEVSTFLSRDIIQRKIYFIRGKKVMFDRDLAALYGIETGNLNKAVARNLKRFPSDFMFQLSDAEFKNLIFQFGRSSWGGLRKKPSVFTEHGILMLSSVLNSERAVQVNIQIMRTFTKIKEFILSYGRLQKKVLALEQKYDAQFRVVFETIREIEEPLKRKKQRRIGFHIKD